MRFAAVFAFVGALAFASASPLIAQTPAPPAPETPTITTQSNLVVVPALVRTKSGQLVYTLKAEDFRLTDDGVPQKLRLETDTGAQPLALVIVAEGGGAAIAKLGSFGPIATMLDTIVGGGPHKVAVVAFDSRPEVFQAFTPDMAQVDSALEDLITGDSGDPGAAILDALGMALDMLRKQPPQYRRAILLISESQDRSSTLSLDDALREISDTNTAIYSIGFSTGRSEAKHYATKELPTQPGGAGLENADANPPGGCMGKVFSPSTHESAGTRASEAYDCLGQLLPPLALAKMAVIAIRDSMQRNIPETVAHVTGGEYFELGSPKSLERNLQTISNHMSNRYLLTFEPQSPRPGFHVIKLTLPDYAHLQVSARDGYWVDGAAAPPSQAGSGTR